MINVGIAGYYNEVNRHARALDQLPQVSISDRWITDDAQDGAVDARTGAKCTDPEVILAKADAWIFCNAGNFINRILTLALRKAKHVFLYPWVIRSSGNVYPLIKLAREANVILKCAATGKYNLKGLLESIPDPRAIAMIEFQHGIRITNPPPPTTISEVLLSDIEIINALIKARNTFIKAKGLGIFNSHPNIINARLEFDNGSAVNYCCNMLSLQDEHLITVMLRDSVLRYNLINNDLSGWYFKHAVNQKENPIFMKNIRVESSDRLNEELTGFFSLIRSGPAFLSIYDNGFEPYMLSDRIIEKASKTLVQYA